MKSVSADRKKFADERLLVFIFLSLLTAVVSIPLFQALLSRGLINGDDALTHIQRVEGMLASIKQGVLPPRIHLSTLQNYGYGAGFFYPQVFLLLPVLMRGLGLNFILSTNLSLIFLNFITAWSAFFAVRRISSSPWGAAAAAVLYTFASYHIADLYYRSTAGESIAFVFIPWLVLGFYEVFQGRESSWPFISLGLAGLVLSHLLSALLSGFFLLIFCLIHLRRIWKDRGLLRALLKALLCAMALSAWFWIPMLEQLQTGNIMITNHPAYPLRGPLAWEDSFRVFRYWFRDADSRLIDPLICVPLLCLLFIRRRSDLLRCADWLLGLGLCALLLSSDLFPWQCFPTLNTFIQFPWRLQFISASLLALSGGLMVAALPNPGRQLLCLLLLGFALGMTLPVLRNATQRALIPSPGYRAIENEIGVGENLPVGASVDFILKNGEHPVLADPALQISRYQSKGLSASFDYAFPDDADPDALTLELPFLYYKGWRFRLNDGPNQAAAIGPHGLVQVRLSEPQGTIYGFYQKTFLQILSEIISAAAWVGGIICLWLTHKRKRMSASSVR